MASTVQQSLRKAQIALKNGDFHKAELLYKQILDKFPKNNNAILGYQKSLLKSGSKGHQTLDVIQEHLKELIHLYSLGKFELVLLKINKIVGLFPNSHELMNLQGACNAALGWNDLAITSYKNALKIKPNYIDARNNYAGVYYSMGQELFSKNELGEALKNYQKAVQIWPNFADAHNNIGIVLTENGELTDAITSYDAAIKAKPDYLAALMAKLYLSAQICDWQSIKDDYQNILKLNMVADYGSPFTMLSLEDNPERHLKRSQNYVKNKFKQSPLPVHAIPKVKPNRLRIGYFSSDFHAHPVMYLIIKMLTIHDRENFEIYGYSLGPEKNDGMRHRLIEAFDYFEDVKDLKDSEVAQLARQQKIDIAVDLNGYTINSRSGIFAYQAAPIQINYLGYPGTMGAKFIDYIIADQNLIPVESQKFYSEKPIYLPHHYQPQDNSLKISEQTPSRLQLGLPEGAFVFCAINAAYKISPNVFNIWMQLLSKVDGSVLWLLESNIWAKNNLISEAKKHKIDATQIIFAKRTHHEEYLAQFRQADLYLDTFIYNAGATASNALWAGLPVLTMMGRGYTSRMAGSLLKSVGLPELVTNSELDYKRIALDLANNPKRLKQLRQKLKENLTCEPLFNTELYTKHLELGYIEAYQKYFDGLAPEAIQIS